MPVDHIRYDLLTQAALRGVVRTVLADVAKRGLPGEHHFKVTFRTTAPGVRLSDRMRAQYPQEMTIVLQHQFWDMLVNEEAFEVGLSFGGVPERVAVPFEAISAFVDPAAQFGFQFEIADATAAGDTNAATTAAPQKSGEAEGRLPAAKAGPGALPHPGPSTSGPTLVPPNDGGAGTSGGGEIVQLDRFRKK